MRFTKLRLLGFKSFVEPMEFVIEDGLTGVVGPNGCGKSNLVEALRWVMGENSYKNMRASGMDDVIFSGSGIRPARNSAEVTLFLDNLSRNAPAQFNQSDELQVARRIERASGSVYRINGKEVRAKDVQLLFADQSTGARSPSMVGQGRIGELIQAKPQARRAILEEAAGISGLYSRRHEAELRLRGAETNLDRLEDIIGELATQVESLKRQSRQAIRFKTLSADIRSTEASLLYLRWAQATHQEAQALSSLNQATSKVGEMAQAQMLAAKQQAVAAQYLPDLRYEEAALSATVQRLSIAVTQIDEEAERAVQRRSELQTRLEQLSSDIVREQQMVRDNIQILSRFDEEEQDLLDQEIEAGSRADTAAQLLSTSGQHLSLLEAQLVQLTSQRGQAQAERLQNERLVTEISGRRGRLADELQSVIKEGVSLEQELRKLNAAIPDQDHLINTETAVELAEARLETIEGLVEQSREQELSRRQPLTQAREKLGRIETEAKTLVTVLHRDDDGHYSAAVDQMLVDKGYEGALGAALGEDLYAPVNPQAPVFWGGTEELKQFQPLPDGVKSMAQVVQAPNQLHVRLSQIGIVEDDEGSLIQHKLQPGQRLVSREGSLWRWDGFTARADAPTPAAQRLAQKNRLLELEQSRQDAQQELQQAEADVAQAEADLRDVIEQEKVAREELRHAQRQLTQVQDGLREAERIVGKVAGRKAALNEAQLRLTNNLAELSDQLDEAQLRLTSMIDLYELDEGVEHLSAEVSTARSTVIQAKSSYAALQHEAQSRIQRLEMIKSERNNWLSRAESVESQIRSLVERRAAAEHEMEALTLSPLTIAKRRSELLDALTAAEANRQKAIDRLTEAETEQASLDKKAAISIQELAAARETRIRAEERFTALEKRRKDIEVRIAEDLNCTPQELTNLTGQKPAALTRGAKKRSTNTIEQNDDAGIVVDDADIQQAERQLERLRLERERLGAVNLRAEEEQRELSERHGTIVKERDDVLDAIKMLRQGIQSLNKEGRERLLTAYELVNEQFQRLFIHLFGGGTAQLQLIESDDPLEAGLEILARPPGKKPQTMTLLSGGEQALTAMALIFAVFLTNPSPICVLDEVDAPLDDHNVERFCNLMDEMAASTKTRFIIITHNPITMARMNRLFGVTMAEQGVSQLVSVDLQTAANFIETG